MAPLPSAATAVPPQQRASFQKAAIISGSWQSTVTHVMFMLFMLPH